MADEQDNSLIWRLGVEGAEAAARDIQEFNRRIDVAERALKDVAESANKAEAALRDVAGDVKVNVDDSEVHSIASRLADLAEPITTRINVVRDGLNEALDIVGQIARPITIGVGLAAGAAAGIVGVGIKNLIDIDTTLSQIQARTGRMIPDAEKLINDIWVAGWGESREQIGEVLTLAFQLDIPIADVGNATQRALQVAEITGGDAKNVLAGMQGLLDTGLVKSFSEAADVLVVGYQNGVDRAGDLQDSLREFGPAFAEARITAEGMLSIFDSALDAGVENTAKVGEGFNVLRQNIAKIGTDEGITEAFNRLDELSSIDLAAQLDLYQQGKISGDQFYNALFDALREAPDDADRQTIANSLFGTFAEDYGDNVIAAIDPITAEFSEMAGATEIASQAIQDNLGEELDNTWRTLQQEVANFLSSDQLNLDEKLDDVKRRLQLFSQEIQEGNTLGGALEVALEIPGLEDQIERLESTLGNFAIALLEAVAGVLEAIGQAEAAAGVRGGITDLAKGQLTFDLQVAEDAAGVTNAVRAAVERGVSEADVNTALSDAVNEMLAGGDVAGAQALVDSIAQTFDERGGELRDHLLGALSHAPEATARVRDILGITNLAEATNEELTNALAQVQQEFTANFIRFGTQTQEQLEQESLAFDLASQLSATSIDVDEAALQGQVDQLFVTLSQQMVEAVENQDFNLAAEIAEQMGSEDLAEQLRKQADEAAKGLKAGLDDAALATEEAGGRIEEANTAVEESFDKMVLGAYDALFGHSLVPDVLAAADQIVPAFQNVSAESEDMANQLVNDAALVAAGFEGFVLATGRVNILVDAIVTGMGNALPVLDAVIIKLGQIAVGGSTAAAIVDQVESSSFGAVEAASLTVNSGGNSVQNNHNANVNVAINTGSQAQSTNAGYTVAEQVRGV